MLWVEGQSISHQREFGWDDLLPGKEWIRDRIAACKNLGFEVVGQKDSRVRL